EALDLAGALIRPAPRGGAARGGAGGERPIRPLAPDHLLMTRTFWAWGPFGPVVTSNSTLSFSCRFRKPEPEMALKWTKTSGPDSCVMNPKPLSPLNHLTVPVVIGHSLHSWPDSNARFVWPGGSRRRGNCPQSCYELHPQGSRLAG